MAADIQELLRLAAQIRDATQAGENTAIRVGTELYNIVMKLSEMLGAIDKKLENEAVINIVKEQLRKITIASGQLADGSVTHTKLAESCVGKNNLQDGSVTSDKVQQGAIKHEHLTENCITTGNIKDGSVTTKKLAPDVSENLSKEVLDSVSKDFPPRITEEQVDEITY